MMKDICFLGDSLSRIREFPDEPRLDIGYALDLVQRGKVPADIKRMSTVGAGVYEIRVHESDGTFRVFYVANRPEAVYVLHAFHKKTEKTPKHDIELGRKRYREIPRKKR